MIIVIIAEVYRYIILTLVFPTVSLTRLSSVAMPGLALKCKQLDALKYLYVGSDEFLQALA